MNDAGNDIRKAATPPDTMMDPLAARRGGLIGTAVARVDGAVKVKGEARFCAEFAPDGLAYAALAYSTIPRGRIAAIDAGAAEAAPGVILVMSHLNAPRLNAMPMFLSAPKATGGDRLAVFQDDLVHWNGQPVALVLAATQEQADHAMSLLRITYEAAPALTRLADAKAASDELGKFLGQPLQVLVGDADAALAEAPARFAAGYATPRYNHNAIEPHAVTVAWDGDHLRIHDSAQSVVHNAWTMAQVFGIDERQVHVTSPFCGGGFGSKTVWRHYVLAAAAAKLAGRPVRLALSREGVYRVVGGRTLTEQHVALGADADGRFLALAHTGTTVTTPQNDFPEPFILASSIVYGAPNIKLEVQVTRMHMVANTFMRAPGEAVGTFALESAVDEFAEQLGMDPIALRLRNEPDKDPVKGTPFSARNLAEAYRIGAERFGWDARSATPGARREGEWLVGMGCATATYPYHRMPGGAARITLSRDGGALVEFAAHEMGMGTATTQAIVVAERLGLPLDKVRIGYGDSTMPGLILAGGSQQTASVGFAILDAQRALVQALLDLAGPDSPLHGLAPEQVGMRDGGLYALDAPARADTYVALLQRAGRDTLAVEGNAPPPTESQQWSMHSYGAIFCEARVNTVTGEPRVTRLLGVFDCGRVINARTAASQFRGGMIMGLGMALMEETLYDERSGRIVNASLAEYHVPAHLDVPEIEVLWTDIPDPQAPVGARGIGEIGITGTSAAIANAIYNACGVRVRDLPITLDKLADGLDAPA